MLQLFQSFIYFLNKHNTIVNYLTVKKYLIFGFQMTVIDVTLIRQEEIYRRKPLTLYYMLY